MDKKPQRAEDLLKTNNEILFDSDSNSGSYEDDTVISKEQYDKHKQLTFKKIETTTTPAPIKSDEAICEKIETSEVVVSEVKATEKNRQPRIIKYETVDSIKKGIRLQNIHIHIFFNDFSMNYIRLLLKSIISKR